MAMISDHHTGQLAVAHYGDVFSSRRFTVPTCGAPSVKFPRFRNCISSRKPTHVFSQSGSLPMTDSVVYEHTRENFLELYPELRDCIVNDEIHGKPQEFGKEWITKMLDYNVPKGKLNRGMAVFDVVSSIKGKNEITKDDIKNANVVGWCIEWLQAFFLVEDDIMDGAITRRGQPCWYKQPHVGLIACNDGLMIESSIYRILKKFFAEKDYYIQLVELFHESISRTTYGQMLDLITTPREKGDLSRCTIENYFDISTYKTAYYSFYMPIASGLIMAGIKAKSSFKIAEDILIPMGQYFQIQDDYLDCFADPEFLGKIGTDIQDKKCSWLLCKALSQCSPSQTAILMEKYGEQDESSVNEVKSVYKELNLEQQYLDYEESSYKQLKTLIEEQNELPKEAFFSLLDRIYKRKK